MRGHLIHKGILSTEKFSSLGGSHNVDIEQEELTKQSKKNNHIGMSAKSNFAEIMVDSYKDGCH